MNKGMIFRASVRNDWCFLLKSMKQASFELSYMQMKKMIAEEFGRLDFVLELDKLTKDSNILGWIEDSYKAKIINDDKNGKVDR